MNNDNSDEIENDLPLCDKCIAIFKETNPPYHSRSTEIRPDTTRIWHDDGAHFRLSQAGGPFRDIVYVQCDFCLFVWRILSPSEQQEVCKLSAVRYGHDDINKLLLPSFATFQFEPSITYEIKQDYHFKNVYVLDIHFPTTKDDNYEIDIFKRWSQTQHIKKQIFLMQVAGSSQKAAPGLKGISADPDRPNYPESADNWHHITIKWLDECIHSHPSCNSGTSGILPTRLLSINLKSDGEVKLQICESHEVTEHKYIALSYCWGSQQFLKLTNENYGQLAQEIMLHDLPTTFSEAVLIALWLNVKYLWIDALCIIQDSEEDWTIESANMAQIYSEAFCTISATASISAFDGLNIGEILGIVKDPQRVAHMIAGVDISPPFIPEESSWINSIIRRVMRKSRETENHPSKALPHGTYKWFDPDLWNREITNSPASRRGWITQERVLSTRILHFCKNEMFFECRELQASRNYPDGFPKCVDESTSFKRNVSFPLAEVDSKGSPVMTLKQLQTWAHIVALYSATELTRGTDKLVAISSLAAIIAERTNSTYHAGLWDYRIEQQLLWKTESPGHRPAIYQAPTWSWASVNSKVDMPEYYEESNSVNMQILVSHVRVVTQLVDQKRPYGELDSAGLALLGHLIPGTWKANQHDADIIEPGAYARNLLTCKGKESASFFNYSDFDGDVPENVFLLPIRRCEYEDDEMRVEGIILHKISAIAHWEEGNQYARCGWFDTDDDFDDEEEVGNGDLNTGESGSIHWVLRKLIIF